MKQLVHNLALQIFIVFLLFSTVACSSSSTSSSGDLKIHSDTEFGYSIAYPSSWQPPPEEWMSLLLQKASDRKIIYAVISPDQKLNLQISILNDPPRENETLQEIWDRLKKDASLPHENAMTDAIQVDGVNALREFADTTTEGGFSARYVHTVFVLGGRIWIIVIGGNRTNFLQEQEEIVKIIESATLDSRE